MLPRQRRPLGPYPIQHILTPRVPFQIESAIDASHQCPTPCFPASSLMPKNRQKRHCTKHTLQLFGIRNCDSRDPPVDHVLAAAPTSTTAGPHQTFLAPNNPRLRLVSLRPTFGVTSGMTSQYLADHGAYLTSGVPLAPFAPVLLSMPPWPGP